jgi:hypothetical protein
MKIRVEHLAVPEPFDDFCDRHGIELVVKERARDRGKLKRWYASTPPGLSLETQNGGILTGTYGDGDTPEEAVDDFARNIRGKRLVKNAYKDDRREFCAPSEWGSTPRREWES